MAEDIKRPLKVFLCHAHEDKATVRKVYKRLVAEGVDAWLDEEKLLPGQDWNNEILRALQDSDAIVICLSKVSVAREGYVQREIKEALKKAEEKPSGTIFVIPAKLNDCEVPVYLKNWQWVDLFEDNGFQKLLRSLKIRADKVGAVIVPPSYEDEDTELEKRLEQLYTDGLAAFYTEDWDRACKRFEAILRERPNHKNATEKLAQAERQRNLAKLYTQAAEAYQLEKWLVAIQALEELLGKSGNYRDSAQLLADAKKRNQLKELYAEAKRLNAAQKWQAVVKVFEQISLIEPVYPDPEGLLPIAQTEAAKLKRLADLNDLYRQGIHQMDAGEWYEARGLLEKVHKAQTGFLDTERLLRKIEDEILRIEEGRKRNAQVQMFYEQARKMTRSGQWGKALTQMEEIQRLDPQFVDSDGILEKSKAGLEREEQETQQRKELSALYAEAVSLLEAKKYQEALEKWNAIQAIDPKYKDTSRVKTIARRKLDELSRPEPVDRPWPTMTTDWFRVEANIPVEREILAEWLLLLSFVATLAIGLVYAGYINLFHITSESSAGIRFLEFSILGGLFGATLAFALHKTIHDWQKKQSWTVIIGWFFSYGLAWVIWEYYFARASTSITSIVISLLATAVTILAIKWARPKSSLFSLIVIFVGWVFAWNAGNILANHLAIFNPDRTSLFVISAFVDALVFMLGLLFTFGMQIERSREVLKTVFVGALGFAVGNYALDILGTWLSFPAEIAFALWGLIGGAILEAPSRDARRILISAGICGAGLLVGSYIAFSIFPIGQYTSSTTLDRYNTLRQPFYGIGLGLALGLLSRRASAIGVLTVLFAGIYIMTRALNNELFNLSPSWENILRGALIGLVIGYGYGYMRRTKPQENISGAERTSPS